MGAQEEKPPKIFQNYSTDEQKYQQHLNNINK